VDIVDLEHYLNNLYICISNYNMGAILKKCFANSYEPTLPMVNVNKSIDHRIDHRIFQLENTVSVMEKNIKDVETKNADLQVKYIVLETKHDTLFKRIGELKNEFKVEIKDTAKQIKMLELQVLNILMEHSELLEDDIIIVHE